MNSPKRTFPKCVLGHLESSPEEAALSQGTQFIFPRRGLCSRRGACSNPSSAPSTASPTRRCAKHTQRRALQIATHERERERERERDPGGFQLALSWSEFPHKDAGNALRKRVAEKPRKEQQRRHLRTFPTVHTENSSPQRKDRDASRTERCIICSAAV